MRSKALWGWTSWMLVFFVALLGSDLISEGPERITAERLIIRFLVFGVGWFAGVLVIRWRARRARSDPDRADDGGA